MSKSYHLKLALIYLIFGILWILLSDLLVFQHITDSFTHYKVGILKGILFVLISSALIYYTSRFLTSRIRKHEESNRTLTYLINNATDAIMVKSEDGRIIYWNKGAEDQFGWSREEVLGRDMNEVLKYDEDDISNIIYGIENYGQWFGEIAISKKNGKKLTTYSRWSRIGGFEGYQNSVLVISSDISDVKELETRLERVQRLENLGLLSSGIAHDLNNVIQPILMSSDILRERVSDSKLQKFIDMIRQSARRGTELVEQVLTFTKGLKSKKSYVDTAEIINEIIDTAERTFPGTVSLNRYVEQDIDSVFGSRTQLDQVLTNLIVNARDAVKYNGEIKVMAENFEADREFREKHHIYDDISFIKITVSDNGRGIEPEIIDKIYEPFFTTKGEEKGTGLGLSTCKRIIDDHEGIIEVDSRVGEGTSFIVYLPSSLRKSSVPLIEKLDLNYTGSGEYVLVADDELFVRELLKSVLETANYRVVTADNGEQALSILSDSSEMNEKISAVITDLEMPNINGEELIVRLKTINPDIKVIVISGSSGLDQFERLKAQSNTKVDSFILKPFSNEKLLNSLKHLI